LAKRQLLRDGASHRKAGDVGGVSLERPKNRGRVICHQGRREPAVRHRRATGAAIVEGDQPVVVCEPVQLQLPRLDGVPQATDQQDVRTLADLLGPDVELADADVLAHV
jgi:hypothetical protein